MFDPTYLCFNHPHSRIKTDYQRIVNEFNTSPSVIELLLNATNLLKEIKSLCAHCDFGEEVLNDDHKLSLFRVQKWINTYLVKKEAILDEFVAMD